MIKTVGIVSLSSGVLGEGFVRHELELGVARLKAYGLNVRFMEHALCGMEYIKAYPEKRAQDLIAAFRDEEIDLVLCAIGGDDTYRIAPYLFESVAREGALEYKPFLGFSDTTINHLMLHRLGLRSFYGQAFLPDVCELDNAMLPYTRRYFEELITTGHIREITPSGEWYEAREDYGVERIGTSLPMHKNSGFELLQGNARFGGEILGGCIDSLFDMFDGARYADMPEVCRRYELFPTADEWRGKIFLLESSEELMPPEKYEKALNYLKNAGVFAAVNGVLVGKPMNEVYHEEYKRLLVEVIADPTLPVLCNISIGHALPRCIIPFGVPAEVDAENQRIKLAEPSVAICGKMR